MYKIRYYINPTLLKDLYYALIYPHILYGIQVWYSTFNYVTKRIEVLQKKAVRMTSNDSGLIKNGPLIHSGPLFNI